MEYREQITKIYILKLRCESGSYSSLLKRSTSITKNVQQQQQPQWQQQQQRRQP